MSELCRVARSELLAVCAVDGRGCVVRCDQLSVNTDSITSAGELAEAVAGVDAESEYEEETERFVRRYVRCISVGVRGRDQTLRQAVRTVH